MGLYTIPCRQCDTMFLWFSGSQDQRCGKCQRKDVKQDACASGTGQSIRTFLFETCTKCGARKRFPGPMLHTGACQCDNETKGTSSP